MEREIDTYEDRKKSSNFKSKIAAWEEAWALCQEAVNDHLGSNVRNLHPVVEKWMCLINRAHGYPVPLSTFVASFHYVEKSTSLKEVFQVYFGVASAEFGTPMYVLFNVELFNRVYAKYCSSYLRSTNYNVDHDRGTVDLRLNNELQLHPAEYFKMSTLWYLLFLFVCHMLAHVDTFHKYSTASYNDHSLLKKSCFYKIFVYGRVKHAFSDRL